LLLSALALTACERPAQTAPEDQSDPNSASLEDEKPEATLESPLEGYPAPTDGAPPAGDATAVPGEAPGAEATVAPTATPEPTAETPSEVIHEVQTGETLLAISLIYGVDVEDIVAANDLPSADVLDVGQQLIIPVGGLPDEPAGDEAGGGAPDPTAEPAGEQIHIVQAGENLFRIALRYGTTVDVLVEYNNLANPDQLEVGQEIRIPPASGE
jgi:LysM repeat protein